MVIRVRLFDSVVVHCLPVVTGDGNAIRRATFAGAKRVAPVLQKADFT